MPNTWYGLLCYHCQHSLNTPCQFSSCCGWLRAGNHFEESFNLTLLVFVWACQTVGLNRHESLIYLFISLSSRPSVISFERYIFESPHWTFATYHEQICATQPTCVSVEGCNSVRSHFRKSQIVCLKITI